jgi:hypothetical protein
MSIFEGWDKFPDLDKANAAKSIIELLNATTKDGKHPIEPVRVKQAEIDKQKHIDFKSFVASQATALERGNRNACEDRHQMGKIADAQSLEQQQQYKDRILPHGDRVNLIGKGKGQTQLPTSKPTSASNDRRRGSNNRSSNRAGNQLRANDKPKPTTIRTVEPDLYADKANGNYNRYLASHAGKRGQALGDRGVVYSPNGTPHYGDSYLDKSLQENLSANQADATAPVTAPVSEIKTAKAVEAKKLKRGKNAQVVQPNGAAVAILAAGAAILAISAIMFPLQYFVQFFNLLIDVQIATSNIRNIASSTVVFLTNIGYLMGFGEDVLKPMSDSFEGMLHNVFGKDKVEFVKLQFAKLSTIVTAGVNIIDSLKDANETVANLAEAAAQNGAKVGNALKAALIIDKKIKWWDEEFSKARAKSKFTKLNEQLSARSSVYSELANITQEIKEADDEVKELEKDAEDKRIADYDKQLQKNAEKYAEANAEKVPTIKEGSV